MTTTGAISYLSTRLQRVYDGLGNRTRIEWSLRDATAVRELLDEINRSERQEAHPAPLTHDPTSSRH